VKSYSDPHGCNLASAAKDGLKLKEVGLKISVEKTERPWSVRKGQSELSDRPCYCEPPLSPCLRSYWYSKVGEGRVCSKQ
jgi:hypothetical protein